MRLTPGMKVELTKDELGIINNALNEVCNGIDLEGEFDTCTGYTVEEARETSVEDSHPCIRSMSEMA